MALQIGNNVSVSSVEAVLRQRVSQFQSNLQRFTRRTLLDAGKRIRQRVVEERLTGARLPRRQAPKGAPLSKRSGDLIRSIRYDVLTRNQNEISLKASIGNVKVYYADRYEDEGRLQFGRIAREVLTQAQDELRVGLAFLARNPGTPGVLSSESAALEAPVSALGSQLQEAWKGRGAFLAKRKEDRAYASRFRELRSKGRRLERAKRSGRRAFREVTSGFAAFGL